MLTSRDELLRKSAANVANFEIVAMRTPSSADGLIPASNKNPNDPRGEACAVDGIPSPQQSLSCAHCHVNAQLTFTFWA